MEKEWPNGLTDQQMRDLIGAGLKSVPSQVGGMLQVHVWNDATGAWADYRMHKSLTLKAPLVASFMVEAPHEVEVETVTENRWVLLQAGKVRRDHISLARGLRRMTPGLSEVVPNPCDCPKGVYNRASIWDMIQHLNDSHHPDKGDSLDKWTRERIADWLETLDADLTVDPERFKEEERRRAQTRALQHQAAMKALSDGALDGLKESVQKGFQQIQEAAQDAIKAMQSLNEELEALGVQDPEEHKEEP